VVTQAEFEELKAADDAGLGSELARLLNLPDTESEEERDVFRHRVLGLALEAYRREQITRAKLVEVSRLLTMEAEEVQSVLNRAGLKEG
jgi:hypothetical protein